MTEKAFETKIRKFLESEGCYCFKVWGGGMQKAGIPDLMVCCNGYFMALEIKGEKGKPSPLQLHHIEQIKKSNGVAVILYPKDFESFKTLIYRLKGGDLSAMEL